MVLCVHASVPMPVCVWVCVLPLLESPRSLGELWKINTLRQLCLFIHLITHYHCITVPLISHHRAQIDTFVLFYHTGVWCNQLNLHLTPDTCTKWTLNTNTAAPTTRQYEKEESKVYSLLVRAGLVCVWCLLGRVTASRSSVLEKGHRAGVEHTNNRRSVERRGWEPRDHLPTRPSQRHMAPAIDAGSNSAHYTRRKCWNSAMWKQSECVRALPRTCTPLCTVIVMVDVGVASLCGTRSREQVGSGWSRESVLIVFVPQSCLAVVKAASTSWEANCSIYTGRRFPFFLSIFFFQMYLFNSFLFYKGKCFYILVVSENGLAAFNPLSAKFIDRI